MALKRTNDTRENILLATLLLLEDEGPDASTAQIAYQAGVAEGTIFNYFKSKKEILNELYRYLNAEVHSALVPLTASSDLREQIWEIWKCYVTWGVENLEGHQVLMKLRLSPRVVEATKQKDIFCEHFELLEWAKADGALSNQTPKFVGEVMQAMADATIAYIRDNPNSRKKMCEAGFASFWAAIT